MSTIEIHAGEGGSDAALFAEELAQAISRHSGSPVSSDGTKFSLHRL